jgi:hypothetical protein
MFPPPIAEHEYFHGVILVKDARFLEKQGIRAVLPYRVLAEARRQAGDSDGKGGVEPWQK